MLRNSICFCFSFLFGLTSYCQKKEIVGFSTVRFGTSLANAERILEKQNNVTLISKNLKPPYAIISVTTKIENRVFTGDLEFFNDQFSNLELIFVSKDCVNDFNSIMSSLNIVYGKGELTVLNKENFSNSDVATNESDINYCIWSSKSNPENQIQLRITTKNERRVILLCYIDKKIDHDFQEYYKKTLLEQY